MSTHGRSGIVRLHDQQDIRMVRTRSVGGNGSRAEDGASRSRGVTAPELLVLVVLLVILAAFAIPSMSPVVLNMRLKGGAWQMAGDLRLARQRAVTERTQFRICLTACAIPVSSGTYSLERNDGSGWVSETGAPLRLPSGVIVSATATSTFFPNGTTVPTSTFCIANQIGASQVGVFKVTVASTGRIRVSQQSCTP